LINPVDLVGMPYRLGADPEKHGAADCLSLARHVVGHYGYTMPAPQRNWYRRLRRKDYSIFPEELSTWGDIIEQPRLGSIVLCNTNDGYAMGGYWYDGCLVFLGTQVTWKRVTDLPIAGIYFPTKQSCATQ
jgi:hypothetical protein